MRWLDIHLYIYLPTRLKSEWQTVWETVTKKGYYPMRETKIRMIMEAACFSESTINEHDYRIGFGNSPLSICSKFAKHTLVHTYADAGWYRSCHQTPTKNDIVILWRGLFQIGVQTMIGFVLFYQPVLKLLITEKMIAWEF